MSYILWRPLIIHDDHALDDLDPREATSAPSSLQLAQHGALDLLVMHEGLEAGLLDADGARQLLQRWLGRNDNRDRLGLRDVRVHADVGDDGRRAVDALELLEGDVLAVERLDQVLLAVDDLEVAVLIPLADVARLEPAVLSERLGRLLLVVVVALEHRGAAQPHLALRVGLVGGEVAGVGEVDQLGLDGRRHGADRLRGPLERVLERAHGGRLGEAVADDHGADGHADELLRVLGHGPTGAQAELHTPTGRLLDLLEDDGIQHATTGEASRHETLLEGEGAPEEAAHDGGAGVDLGDDALLDRLPDGGHTDEHRGLELADVAVAVAHRGVRQGLGVTVPEGGAPVQGGVLEDELEDVGEGEVGEEAVAGSDKLLDDGAGAGDCGEEGLAKADTNWGSESK